VRFVVDIYALLLFFVKKQKRRIGVVALNCDSSAKSRGIVRDMSNSALYKTWKM